MTFVRLKPQHPLASSDSFHSVNCDFLQSAELAVSLPTVAVHQSWAIFKISEDWWTRTTPRTDDERLRKESGGSWFPRRLGQDPPDRPPDEACSDVVALLGLVAEVAPHGAVTILPSRNAIDADLWPGNGSVPALDVDFNPCTY
jgi:hypothetical protein